MKSLQEAASQFEQALKTEDEPATEAALQQLDAILVPLLVGLAALPAAGEVAGQVATIDDAETMLILKRLQRCLLEGDGEAERLWLANRSRLGNAMSKLDFQRLERAIAGWEFDEALQVLDHVSTVAGGSRND